MLWRLLLVRGLESTGGHPRRRSRWKAAPDSRSQSSCQRGFYACVDLLNHLRLVFSICFWQSTEIVLQTLRYGAVVALSAVLEALSDQNDNLTLPLFMWSVLVLSDV